MEPRLQQVRFCHPHLHKQVAVVKRMAPSDINLYSHRFPIPSCVSHCVTDCLPAFCTLCPPLSLCACLPISDSSSIHRRLAGGPFGIPAELDNFINVKWYDLSAPRLLPLEREMCHSHREYSFCIFFPPFSTTIARYRQDGRMGRPADQNVQQAPVPLHAPLLSPGTFIVGG
jgi:hypothetical protein